MSKRATTASCPVLIEDTNLSWAWARIIAHIQSRSGKNIAPLVVSIHGFDDAGAPLEDPDLRRELDGLLAAEGELDIATVGFTIFPERIWRIAAGDRHRFFDLYRRAFPRYQAMNRKLNGKGLYFERLTMFGNEKCGGNQLEYIIKTFTKRTGVRDSMLQAAIFDPARDHTESALIGFPCLQHLSFVPTRDGLITNAFYATQQLFNKAYGNYLGLAQLGAFMAQQLGMKPARLNVFVGVAKLDDFPKTDARLVSMITSATTRRDAASS